MAAARKREGRTRAGYSCGPIQAGKELRRETAASRLYPIAGGVGICLWGKWGFQVIGLLAAILGLSVPSGRLNVSRRVAESFLKQGACQEQNAWHRRTPIRPAIAQ